MNSIPKILFSLLAALFFVSVCTAQPTPPGKKQIPMPQPESSTNANVLSEPTGRLIYCSYSKSSPAGGGKDYCELINENGKIEVVAHFNIDSRFADEIEQTFTATEADVEALEALLKDIKVWQLSESAKAEQEEPGATRYRIYQEYESGERPNSVWYTHSGTQAQRAAYNAIEAFFAKWASLLPTPKPTEN